MRLTNFQIETAVNGVLAPITEAKKEIKNQIAEIVKEHVLSLCPPEVLALHEKESNYIRKERYFYFTKGLKGDVSLDKHIPAVTSHIEITDFDKVEKIRELQNKLRTLVDKELALSSELEAAFKKLRTVKRIKEIFPEAIPFLPTEGTNVPAINYEDTRSKIANLP